MELQRSQLEQRMVERMRRHMLTSLGGFALGIGGLAVSARLFGHGVEHRGALAALTALSIAAIPAIGLTSTFKNLRCPACEGLVAYQVSANASFFARQARKTCRHCGARIFGDELVRGFRRLVIALVIGAFGLGILASLLRLLMH